MIENNAIILGTLRKFVAGATEESR